MKHNEKRILVFFISLECEFFFFKTRCSLHCVIIMIGELFKIKFLNFEIFNVELYSNYLYMIGDRIIYIIRTLIIRKIIKKRNKIFSVLLNYIRIYITICYTDICSNKCTQINKLIAFVAIVSQIYVNILNKKYCSLRYIYLY